MSTTLKHDSRQEEVVSWFDNTYRTRGKWYLRPVKAYYIFLELLEAKPKHKLLDVACGLGRLLEAGTKYGCSLTGVDISAVAVEQAQKSIPSADIRVANAESLPFEDASFDLISCLGSLERMLDLQQVLAELHRVGTPTARYCFLVRNSETTSWSLMKALGIENKKGHQGAESLSTWQNIFAKAGFSVKSVYPDQYDLHKWQQWTSLGLRKVDYRHVVSTKMPLTNTSKFLFILEKLEYGDE